MDIVMDRPMDEVDAAVEDEQQAQKDTSVNLMEFERIQMRRCSNRNHAMFGRNTRCRTCYPAPRSGHRLFCDNGYVYVLGGYNPQRGGSSLIQDLWAFNVYTDEWSPVRVDGKFPEEMASFSVTQSQDKNFTFMFGGTAVPFGRRASNNLYALIRCGRFDHWKWVEVPTVGEARPTPVYGQSMIYIEGDGIYIIGGTTGFQYNMDVHKLKQPLPGCLTESMLSMEWEWSFEKSGAAEIGRYRHEMIPVFEGFLIIGGGTPNSSLTLDTLLMYNVKKKTYEQQPTKQDEKYGYPLPRRCHAVVRCGDEAFVLGGCKDTLVPLEDMPDLGRVELTPLSDLWSLDLNTYQWKLLPSTLADPVFFHAAALTRDGCLYSFGGCNDRNSTIRSDRLERVWLRPPTLLHATMRQNAQRFRTLFREYDANHLQKEFSSLICRAVQYEKNGHVPEFLPEYYDDEEESDSDSD
uniref:Kelch domain-containing protein 10 n=1 Tax=Steinernema glaseri TaxID=37863 RepID=A0A1I7Y786_9BILA